MQIVIIVVDTVISIHALLAESDQADGSTTIPNFNFYPRSPCGERPRRTYQQGEKQAFLSTLSLRRATIFLDLAFHERANFYPRSPCGERQVASNGATKSAQISIHALLAESDESQPPCARPTKDFYPRSPCGERRESQPPCARPTKDFYPRSPCGERHNLNLPSKPIENFYPRSPCGERLGDIKNTSLYELFLSTLSLRRATN